MKRKTCVVLFVVLMVGSFVVVSAQDEETVKIHMLGERTRTRFGSQVIVAGIWHYINVTMDTHDFQRLHLKLYSGPSMPDEADRDETTYYEWQYHQKNESPWTDIKKYGDRQYINTTRSTKNANNYNFCVGIKDTLPFHPTFSHENWTLEVYKNGDKIYSEIVVVEKPISGLAKLHGDAIIVNVDPFTPMDAYGHDFFIIKNTGNLPLDINVDYGDYNSIFEYSGFNTTVSPNRSIKFDPLLIHSESWPPGNREIKGTLTGEIPRFYIIPVAPLTFGTSLGIDAPMLRIVAAHADYELIEEFPGDITFQYQKTLEMNESEIKDITSYISGNGIINFDVSSKNLTIVKVFSEDNDVNPPFVISSMNTSEHVITTRVKAIRETSTAILHYVVEIGGKIYEYDTLITISSPQSSGEEVIILDFFLIVVIVVIICLVIGYIIYTHLKYSRN